MRPGITSDYLINIVALHIAIDAQPSLKSTVKALFDWILGHDTTLPTYSCDAQPILKLVLGIIEPYVDDAFGVSSAESRRIAYLLNA